MSDTKFGGLLAQTGTGLLFATAALSLALLSSSRPLVGVAGYALFGGAGVILQSRSEDDSTGSLRPRTPAGITLTLIGLASAVVFPALAAADGLGYFTWTPLTVGVALSVAVLYAVYGFVSVGRRLWGRPA